MELQRRPSGFALVIFATALALSCSDSETPPAGSGGDAPAGSAGQSGSAGTTGGAGAAGTAGTAGATSAGTAGVTGGAGTNGSGGRAGAAGNGGTTSTGGSAGSAGSANGGGGTNGGGTSGGGTSGGGTSGGGTSGGTAGGSAGTAGSGATGVAPSAGCSTPAALTSGRASIDVDGKMREYILALPDDYDPDQPYRLIFGWHPWGGSAQQIAGGGYFGLESVIDGQAILVAPEGQDFQDNGLGWGNEDGEDIAFLHAMIDRFGAGLCIDENRIFSTGFSFGAMFSFTLACTADSRMRAIAPQAGNATTSGRCEDGTRSVATMAFIGTDDTLIDGHRQAVEIFAERNGCSTETAPAEPSWCDELTAMYEPCTCVEYQGCDEGYPVIACEYTAGHQFAPNAGETLWNFFSQF